jgi:peptidoglycan/xylan/chitin deacetylase (PgdA/CDA1 family)
MPGIFVVSLDFELMWGVLYRRDGVADYDANILGVRQAIPEMLNLFSKYEIHATWATVGLLFFSNKEDMLRGCPQAKPAYQNSRLSPYTRVPTVGADESHDPYHFGHSLLQMIRGRAGQEIGSHTFSHYYCLEPGQTDAAFRADLQAAKRAADALGVQIQSLVFPRNQINKAYLEICAELGIKCYRGTEQAWFYRGGALEHESIVTRAHRLFDSYANISGHNTYTLERNGSIVNLPASRFLRPHNGRLAVLDDLKFQRIASGIRDAAQKAKIYHLWWHPHNFGIHLNENMAFLRRILDFVSEMRNQHGMQSLNMGETSQLLSHAR